MQFPSGKTVVGRITNTAVDSETAIAFTDINGGTHTFATGERLIIHNIYANNRATAKSLTIFQDASGGDDEDAGEELWNVSFGGVDNAQAEFSDGLPSLKINAAATNNFFAHASTTGAVDIIVVGEVIKS